MTAIAVQIYWVLLLITAFLSIFKQGIYQGLAGFLAPSIAALAARGVAFSIKNPRLGVFIAVSPAYLIIFSCLYWIHKSGYNAELFSFKISGAVWCLIGCVIAISQSPVWIINAQSKDKELQ
jgi:hypothetical protein